MKIVVQVHTIRSLTEVHHVVVHAIYRHHFHEVVVVVFPLWNVGQVSVVLEQIAEELRVQSKTSVQNIKQPSTRTHQ